MFTYDARKYQSTNKEGVVVRSEGHHPEGRFFSYHDAKQHIGFSAIMPDVDKGVDHWKAFAIGSPHYIDQVLQKRTIIPAEELPKIRSNIAEALETFPIRSFQRKCEILVVRVIFS